MMYPAEEPDVIDLGSRHFIRPHHLLVRTSEPDAYAVLASPDSEVLGLMWWHDCRTEESRWLLVLFPVGPELICPFVDCGDRGRIVDGRWMAA